jgi:hypothetical protein
VQQRLHLVSQDKEFLAKDNHQFMDQHKRLVEQLEEAHANVRRLESSKEAFQEQMAKSQEEARVLFDVRDHIYIFESDDDVESI